MTFYLISFLVIVDEAKIIAGNTLPLKSKTAQTITEIDAYLTKYHAGPQGVLYITSLQKISEKDYEDYGGHEEISFN